VTTRYAVRIDQVPADAKMRTHAWLNIHTLTKKFSVIACMKKDGKWHWAHVYNPENDDKIYFFRVERRAERAIDRIRKGLKV
jgi:hypothetical protein